MILIVCIDKTIEMAFNNRGQSQDVRLRERILSLTKEGTLLMNGYLMKMFGDHPQIRVDENFLDNAIEDDYCFAENVDVVPYEDKIDNIVLYKWNKTYPSELKFGILLSNRWKLVKSEDFQGNSHKNITDEIYEKVK